MSRGEAYLMALALAHMLSPSNSEEEDKLADCLNLAGDEPEVDRLQRWACGRGPWTIGPIREEED